MIKIRIRNDDHEIDLQFPISENKLYAKLAEIHAIEGKDAPQSAFVTEVYWPEELSMLKDRFANLDELKAHYRRGGLGDVKVKRLLIAILNEMLDPIRERRRHYETRIGEVYDILREGSAKARAAAAETLADVRAAMKINYFDDRELIDGQTEHFKLKTEN